MQQTSRFHLLGLHQGTKAFSKKQSQAVASVVNSMSYSTGLEIECQTSWSRG